MDVDTPILIEKIMQIIERHPGLSVYKLDYLRKIRDIKDVSILYSLKKILCFLDEKSLLDQHLLNFIIENTYYINQLSIFLNWLKEINVSSSEILDSLKQFDDLSDIDKVIARLGELESRSILDGQIDFTFFSGLVDLINEDMDEEKYIDLIRDVENTPTLLKALKILKRNDLLQDPYYEFVFDKEDFFPVIKAELISKLKKNDALTEQNFNVCKKNTSLILLMETAKILERYAISLRDNFLPLATKNIHALLGYLKYLEKNSLVTEEQITAIKRASDNTLKYLIHIVSLADEVESSTELSCLIVENSEKLRKLSKSLMLLKNENYLTAENYRLLSTNVHYPDVVFQFTQALVVLRNNQLDDVRWKNEAYNSENPLQLVFLLKELNKVSILSDANLSQIKKVYLPHCFLRILRVLNRLHGLTEETFANLIKLDRVLASSYPLYERLSRMKSISLELMSDFFLISSEDLDKTTKLEKIEQLLELEGKASINKPRLSINREQSTHVSSVQFSISQSAKRFLQKYGGRIIPNNLDKNFLEITDELKALASDDNVKNRAAFNALEKIISQSDYIEPISKLNFRELLVLLWAGIQDDSERISSLLDAKIQIIEGLYEIQRGGNIDVFGQDNGLPDEAICCTGAFNKLVEKMVGIHQFAEVINITPELAATKFPLIVKAKAVDYLISLDPEQLLLSYDLLKEEGIAFIWKHIASNVQEAMLAEFSSLYQLESGQVNEDFRHLMASHQDLDIDERLLASIKSAYALRKLDLATSVNIFSDCGEISGVNQRLTRSVHDCFKRNTAKEKRYRPFFALHPDFEYALSFFMALEGQELEKSILEKIEILQKMAKDKYLAMHAFDDFAKTSLEGICEIWPIAERFLNVGTDINEANLIELSFSEKKCYIGIKHDLYSVGSNHVYCSALNKEKFLEVNSDIDLEEVIEIFKEILYPDKPLYQIKTRYLSYFHPGDYLLLSDFRETFFGSIETLSDRVSDFEGVPRKGFYEFFLIEGKSVTEADVNFLSNYGLESARLSFILEKAPEVLSYFSKEEQIALGKLLLKYRIPTQENENFLTNTNLNKFNKDLLKLLIDYARRDEVINEKQLTKLASEACYAELIKTDLDSEEATLLLEDLVQSHNQVKLKLENLVEVSRLSILLAPALLKALNGHSDNLMHLTGIMGGDYLINQSYLKLIEHEGFIKRFPKFSTLLQKGRYGLASPITKLLLLTSFYELTKQLLNTASNTPEYKMAQALLVDNTILFSALFAEAFGLALGPAGIILDLGITIHQLLIASDYIRQHYHLQISLWEGIKFELGFNGIVSEILESREIVRLSLVSINNLSKSANYYFSHVVVKGPKVVEIEAKKVERKELPDFLLKKIYLSPLTEITSLKYRYRVDTRMGRVQSYTTVSYLKRRFLIESIQEIFINFSEKNISLAQENNIFFKFETQCSFNYIYASNAARYISVIFSPFGQLFYMEKKCITTNRILIEGWGVASSTTASDQRVGRIENGHSLTIQGDVGAILENKNVFNQDQVWIKVLILFNPLFGNMTIEDGSFLKNQTLVVLIQDPVLADIIVNDRMRSISGFNFTSFEYLNKLHYWVGFNSISSIIEDNFARLSIYLMPLSLDDPEQTITMLSTSQLIVGERGPRFMGLENKREIIIYFKRGYPLCGYFDFTSLIIKLYTPTVKSKEVAIFGLEAYQICSLENIQGVYIFYSPDVEMGHEIIIQVTRLDVNTNVNKQLNTAYFIESNQLLNFLIVNYYEFAWLSYNITELNISWCEMDCPLIKVRSKVSAFLDLTFKGRFKLADKNYTAWFSFEAEKMGCNFFDLNGSDLLLENFASFKELLEKGYTDFNFSKSGYLSDKLEYIAHEKKIIYKKIHYRLDEDYPFVAVIGNLMNSSVYTENFANLLSNVVIDLRNEDQPIRVASNTLQVGDRFFTEVATTALLLTKLGKQYMGLLPIFTPSKVVVANLQVNAHEINESGYLPRLSKRSKDTSDSQLTNWSKGFIVLGSLFTFFILTKTIIVYRRRMNTSPGIIEMGVIGAAIGVPLLSPTVQSSNDNGYLLPASRDYFEQNYKDSNQYFNQGFRGEKSNSFKEAIVFCFEKLPKNIIFLQWCIGLYKKLNKPKNIFLESSFEELLVILAKELTKLSYHQAITTNQKKVLNHLLTSIHRLSFLIKPNTSCVFIIKDADFIVWNDFIRDLFVFERNFKHYFEKGRVRTITKVMDRLDTMSIEVKHGFSNCLDYLAAIERLLKMLASSANTPNMRLCHTLGLPDFQWLIRRLHMLQDALIDFKKSRKLSFSEFKYYLREVLPEAKRLASCLENKYFAIDFSSYLNLVAAMKRDCSEDVLFQNLNISKASNTSLATHSYLAKESFFTLNKRAANITDVDYAANDRNRLDFSARNSNLRNTSHSLG